MTIEYDPRIIAQHAATLYAQASRVIFTHGFLGLIAGAVVGGMLGARVEATGVVVLVVALLGALLGVSIGRSRAFVYRLQAQQALCQVAIEQNTRRAPSATSVPGSRAVAD